MSKYSVSGMVFYQLNYTKMRKFIVKEDCFCQEYLHEKMNYNRDGLVEKRLFVGDEVELQKEWSNCYGTYLRVTKNNEYYDMKGKYLDEIHPVNPS